MDTKRGQKTWENQGKTRGKPGESGNIIGKCLENLSENGETMGTWETCGKNEGKKRKKTWEKPFEHLWEVGKILAGFGDDLANLNC